MAIINLVRTGGLGRQCTECMHCKHCGHKARTRTQSRKQLFRGGAHAEWLGGVVVETRDDHPRVCAAKHKRDGIQPQAAPLLERSVTRVSSGSQPGFDLGLNVIVAVRFPSANPDSLHSSYKCSQCIQLLRSRLLLRDAEQMLGAANKHFIANDRRSRIDAFIERICGQDFEVV